ncbi:MAG: methyltransferase domain-containing protein [Rhizobiaceae bacterium]|nr:methyltransferase domain-containing protein [Rhizobiaceae bacterium]
MTRNLPSGDITADRRAEYARMLSLSGDHAAAADLMAQAMELVPDWAAGWLQLGELAEKAGETDRATAALKHVLSLDGDDVFGAGLRIALIEGVVPPLPPSAYVAGLFNDYAGRFDESLVRKLGYSIPGRLSALVRAHVGHGHRFADAVDLGCGTGLFGAEIAGSCFRLEGYDIADAMLAKAAAKTIYNHLGRADISLPPEQSGLFGQTRRADLVSAADVMIYLGDLDAAFTNVATLIRPSGLFAFSVEKSGAETGFELRSSLRYAHSEAHVVSALHAHGLETAAIEETVIRADAGEPVAGLLFLARKA